MSELRLRHYYLDIEVKQSVSGISPSQGVYAMKILERYDMARCNPYHVRIEARFKLSKRNTHATVGECYSIPKHHYELEVFSECPSRSYLCYWTHESFCGGVVGGSHCSGEADSPLCGGYQQSGALV
jgi:23S rRNA A1618 N6-methylase RlmF